MKFSWKSVNTFIDIQNVQLDKLEEQLTLSGIEIEDVEYVNEIQDKIFDLSITANRKEIYSVISLAKEISIVLNTKLKIFPISFFTTSIQGTVNNVHNSKTLYISICKINNIQIRETPIWLTNYLKIYNINSKDTIRNIQKYIELKWGQKFYILEMNELKDINHLLNINSSVIKLHSLQLNNKSHKNKLIVFVSNKDVYKNDVSISNSYQEYYLNAYIDTMKLISTLTKCTSGTSYHQYNNVQEYPNSIKLNKHKINTVLGKLNQKTLHYLSNRDLILSLQQLKFFPTYNKFLQTFIIKIPSARKHDLRREIDIIEEIGRIKGFDTFLDKLPSGKNKGTASNLSIKIKTIRNTLRQLGFNEVINCCLTNNQYSRSNYSIKLHNPITQEQTELRNNIIQNLIENYKNNIKQKNNTVEIFEIGKIFEHKLNNKYTEDISIGGLTHNNNFMRNNWSDTPKCPSFFHIKGIIEILLERLNAQITFRKIYKDKNINYANKFKDLFHPIKKIGIYCSKNQELVGILGEINPSHLKEVNKSRHTVYIFEISIKKLNRTVRLNKHLNCAVFSYSHYPSVTRDISVKMHKTMSIQKVKNVFSKDPDSLIESIEIFNEYFHKQNQHKSIGLRITYRAKNRTLNNTDIQTIDQQINKSILSLESKT
uniref:phenylalanine--tRNA ligase n=1 Tax=Laurencieae sp. TaxID=2007162 RepID=A0A1Z1M3B1_9FLOR|nr:Phenylalanine-tRNA ligase beta subunit [Laurencieae sp.]